jgi:RNA polymerase sigma-70 factor (ECF subfamily)
MAAPLPPSTLPPSDEVLVERIAAGDRQAFAEIYDRHAARLKGLLVRWFGNSVDADDVLQEVFWQVWHTAPQFSSQRGAVTVWLYLMCRSRYVDFLRRRQPRAPLAARDTTLAVMDAVDALIQGETAQDIHQAMNQLSADQRRAIHLAFFCGLTHEQIAQTEGIPLGTAKTRIWLGIRRLRALLGRLMVLI